MRFLVARLYMLLFLIMIVSSTAYSQTDSATIYFNSANNKLKTKWEHVDSAYIASAISDYSEAIRINPEFWQAYRNRARVYIFLKDNNAALQDLTSAITFADKVSLPNLFEMRGNVFFQLGFNQEAIDDYSGTISMNKESANAYFQRSQARWKLKQKKEACKDLQEAINLNKEFEKKNRLVKCD